MAGTLNGQWLKILEARHYGDDVEFTPKDLDSIVRQYGKREEDAPVGVGTNWRGAKSFGSVADLRRDGNFLSAKFDRVAPQLEKFYQETDGAPKVLVALKKTPNGPMLQRIGLARADGTHPREDDLGDPLPATDAYGNTEVVFSERQTASFADWWAGIRNTHLGLGLENSKMKSRAAISLMKEGGFWMDRLDHNHIPKMLEMCEGTTAFEPLVTFFSEGLSTLDADGSVLTERAKWWARTHDVTFGEALDTLVEKANKGFNVTDILKQMDPKKLEQQRQLEEDQAAADVEKAGRWDPQYKKLGQLALQRMRSKGIPFKQALEEISAEHPELVTLEARIRMNHGVVT